MAAISKAWVAINDGGVDPDSPGDSILFTGIRDDLVHLREWLGASFVGGAVQDHNHDGENSAPVPVGPNQVRNGSFEDGDIGWTFTDFTGGSHAISTESHRDGAKSATMTSTVLANGGAQAFTNEFMLASEGDALGIFFWVWASTINVSSRVEALWYDNTKTLISSSLIFDNPNTPLAPAFFETASVSVPANARFFRIRITGGVPGSGSATGTIVFDGIRAGSVRVGQAHIVAGGVGSTELANDAVGQAHIVAGAVGQGELKTTTASGSTNIGGGVHGTIALTGGTYSWWTASSSSALSNGITFGSTNTAAGTLGLYNNDAGGLAFNRDERYVQASPPYTHGPTFVFLMLDGLGNIVNVEVGFDPTWAYHGPTDITPQFWRSGVPYRRMGVYDGKTLREIIESKDDPLLRAVLAGRVEQVEAEREITLAYKDSDMNARPHPWCYNRPGFFTGMTVVMLEPGTALMLKLQEIADQSHAHEVLALIRGGYITVDNRPLGIPSLPAAVRPLRANWKLTA